MASMLETLSGQAQAPAPGSRQPEAPQQVPSLRFVLYDARDDSQADAFLSYLWRRLQKDDLVDYYFPGQKQTGFAQFCRMMSGDAHVALVVTNDESKQWDRTIAGFITWTTMHMGASEVVIAGFIFFREFWDHRTTDEAGRQAFKLWFENYKDCNMVLGVCPADHVVALRYNRRIGLKEKGRLDDCHLLKGQVCDAVLVGISRREWEATCRSHQS